jgi:hypothetical protein
MVEGMEEFPDRGEIQGAVEPARRREIVTQRQAIALHESAARLFDRQDHPEWAAAARRRALKARKMLAHALIEDEQFTTTGRPHAHASLGLPPEGTTAAVGGGSEDRESARTDDKPRKGTS